MDYGASQLRRNISTVLLTLTLTSISDRYTSSDQYQNIPHDTQNMLTFTFTKKDLLNTALLPSHHLNSSGISYTLSTTTGLFGRKITTLASSGGLSTYTVLGGAINWRKRRFEIGGVQRKWSSLKRRTGLFSRCVPLSYFPSSSSS